MNDLKINSVGRDIFLTIVTFGIWNLYVQYRQIEDVNMLLGREEFPSFSKLIIFSIFTFGLYFCYHEYKMTKILHQIRFNRQYPIQEVAFAFLTLIGLWFIVDSCQQLMINKHIDSGGKQV